MGLAPYDKFVSIYDAMFDMMGYINPLSVATNTEYGGAIFIYPDGSYSYTQPLKGISDACQPNASYVPYEWQKVGYYHTHGSLERSTNKYFSPFDIRGMTNYNYEFLANPLGELKAHIPAFGPIANQASSDINKRLFTIYPWGIRGPHR